MARLAVPIFLLLNLFLTLTSSVFLITSVIISFLIAIIYGVELNAIHRKENYEDDKGMQYKNASLKSDALNNVSPAKSGKKKGLITGWKNRPANEAHL